MIIFRIVINFFGRFTLQMSEDLHNLSNDELIKIILSTQKQFSTLNKENIQLKDELAALSGKINVLLEQNATLNSNLSKFIATGKSIPSQSSNKNPSTNLNGRNKRINEIFPVIASKRSRFDGTHVTSIEQNVNKPTSTEESIENDSIPSGSVMDISASIENSSVTEPANESEWHFVDFKGKKNAHNQKIPPIQIEVSIDGRSPLFALLQRAIGPNKYTINQLKTRNSVRVHPANVTVSDALIVTLRNHGYKFHTYLVNDQKKHCFIIRGLNGIDSSDEVRKHLLRAGLPDNTTVVRHITGYQRANPDKTHNTLYKVIIDANVNADSLRGIQSILGLAIKWEKLKTNGITQCHYCQSYFHTAACCNHEFRCVKCTECHLPGSCNLASDDSAVPHCVNCGGAHTANNHKECPYFLQKIKPIIDRRSVKNNITNKSSSSKINNNTGFNTQNTGNERFSFASLFDKNTSNAPKNKTTENTLVSVPHTQSDFSVFFELMSRSIANQDRILTLLTKSLQNES